MVNYLAIGMAAFMIRQSGSDGVYKVAKLVIKFPTERLVLSTIFEFD